VVAALDTPIVPQMVGRYVLYGAIASGGMATVHFGRLVGPAGFARPVAIKRLHAQFARDPDFVQMFLDEARLAARVTHPNVVQTLDLVEATNEVFLVMEYVRGMSLATLVRSLRRKGERIPPRIALGIVVGVLEGLHAAHEAKDDRGERLDLVHRDVSPQNVLVGTDGIARLLDFGVAKAAGRLQATQDGKVKGKLAYMAPEQVLAQPLTRRTDVYAASVLLWEVLTARRLFFGENDADSLRKVMNDVVPPPSSVNADLPPEIDRIVMRGLERDASKRFANAHQMAVELGACFVPAPPTEIGAWVERTAAEELNERASLIAAIERSASDSMSKLTSVAAVPGEGAPDAPTPVGKRLVDPPTGVREIDGTSATVGAPWRSPSRRWRSLVAAIGVTVLVASSVVVFALRTRSGHDTSPPAVGISPAETRAAAVVPTATTTSPEPTAPEESASTTAAATSASAQAPSIAPASPRTAGFPPSYAPSARRPAATPPSRGDARPGCDPPFTEDAQGHIHFKPQCL
jgi:serine/threonine-protein kinase